MLSVAVHLELLVQECDHCKWRVNMLEWRIDVESCDPVVRRAEEVIVHPDIDRNMESYYRALDQGVMLRVQGLIRKKRLSLAGRFKVGSLTILVLCVLGIGSWVQREVGNGIISGTVQTTAPYLGGLLAPALQGHSKGSPLSSDAVAELDKHFRGTALNKTILALRIWGPDGLVLYDTNPSNVGRVFPMEERLARAWRGQTTGRISALKSAENVAERPVAKTMLETYTPVYQGGSTEVAAVAEFYQPVDALSRDMAIARMWTWVLVTAAMVIIYYLLIGFVERASNTIRVQQTVLSEQVVHLQELLAQNLESSERLQRSAERRTGIFEQFLRRLSADLHDGPAQDLSLALLWLDSADIENPVVSPDGSISSSAAPAQRALELVHSALHRALNELRALSSGLGIPQLDGLSLSATIERAVRADEERTGTTVRLSVGDLPEKVAESTKLIAYRLIQEGLSNTFRYAGGLGQAVDARADGCDLIISISDEGPGFDPTVIDTTKHLGLSGMRERVQAVGGSFQIESAPGCGTRIVACFPCRTEEEYE